MILMVMLLEIYYYNKWQNRCSIGGACYPQDCETDLALSKVADQRMYQQKAEHHASQSKIASIS